jgi:hypothetical protein
MRNCNSKSRERRREQVVSMIIFAFISALCSSDVGLVGTQSQSAYDSELKSSKETTENCSPSLECMDHGPQVSLLSDLPFSIEVYAEETSSSSFFDTLLQ